MNKFINSGHYTTKPAVLLASLISGDKIGYHQLLPLVGFSDGGPIRHCFCDRICSQ